MAKILCIIDGMTEKRFNPKEYHHLSTMKISEHIDTSKGEKPESLNCILHLLGVDVDTKNLRAYAEAVGLGIDVAKDDLVLRGSCYYKDENGICLNPAKTPLSAKSEYFSYHHIESYKSLLVFKTLASEIDSIKTVTPYERGQVHYEDFRPQGSKTLDKTFDYFVKEDRFLIPWGQSVATTLPRFAQKSVVICGTSIVKGIARLLGMDLVEKSDFTGDTDTNLKSKIEETLKKAEEYPFVLLHINGTDEASHRKNFEEKREFLHKVDKIVIKKLLSTNHTIVVTSDHGNSTKTGLHLDDNQPVFTRNGEIRYEEFIRDK